VGDNEGDVAGIKADLFGCFAESTCAALLIKITFLENLSI
jgi:Na+/H+-translocating membrane pyrophosphatase